MRVYTFQPRFARLVRDGIKRQTIRRGRLDRKRTKVGDILSLRQWVGKPYRSRQETLRAIEVCKEVHTFEIRRVENLFYHGFLDGERIAAHELDRIAREDGFRDAGEMLKWFMDNHGVREHDFKGDLIRW